MPRSEDTIIDYLFFYAASFPDKTAFRVLKDEAHAITEVTYGKLLSAVMETAPCLEDAQLTGKPVLLVYQDVLEFIVAFLSCQYTGVIPVPMPYMRGGNQQERFTGIIGDARAQAVLCTTDTVSRLARADHLPGKMTDIPFITTDKRHQAAISPHPFNNRPLAVAFIQYTSGSTAMPKGVVITHRNLMHNQQLIRQAFNTDSSSVIFSWLPFHHDMGLVGNILHTIYMGCTCVLMSPFHFMQRPQRWLEGITRYRATHSGGPNFAYDLCVSRISPEEATLLDLDSWQVAYNGSEPVRLETMQQFARHFQEAGFRQQAFFPCYGLAEATLLVSGGKAGREPPLVYTDESMPERQETLVSAGRIAPGIQVRIIAPDNKQATRDLQKGEIAISGESISEGYYNQDNRSLFLELDGRMFLRTGDEGFIYKGELFICGRLKEMLLVRGRNIYPYDLEQLVQASVEALEPHGVAIFPVQGHADRYVVAAEVKRAFAEALDTEYVVRSIAGMLTGACGLAPYDIILVRTGSIPRTTSGKLQRTKCGLMYRERSFKLLPGMLQNSGLPVPGEPGDPQLARDVLLQRDYITIKGYLTYVIACKAGIAPGQVQDDQVSLSALGIDSLRLMELLNHVNSELQLHIGVGEVLSEATLYGLIQLIEHSLWLESTQPTGNEIII